MNVPSIEYGQLSPILIVLGAAVTGVVVEAFCERSYRYRVQLTLCLVALVSSFGAVLALSGTTGSAVLGAVISDGPASFLQGIVLSMGLVSIAVLAERDGRGLSAVTAQASTVPGSAAEATAIRMGGVQTEVFPLTMFAVAGMLIFVAAGDFLTMFIALEVFSLPLYLMCGLARRRRLLSQEAALKYFLLGAFSSAFFLFGIAMLYGYAGTMSLTGIQQAIATTPGDTTLAMVGTALVTVGLLFKVGAVPFHSWVPDVYQGAPTPITGFMAAATKVAAFGAMLRILDVALPALTRDWRPALSVVAMVTMIVGSVLVVGQSDVKRLLGYSAITQAGFILTGVVVGNGAGLPATLFYLATYAPIAFGAFAVIGLVRTRCGDEETTVAGWAGLGRRHPLVGVIFAIFLLALAGIPLTSGFVGKFAVFKAAAEEGQIALVLVGLAASAVTVYAYGRVVITMYSDEIPTEPAVVQSTGWLSRVAIAASAAFTVVIGSLPEPLLHLAQDAGRFLG